LRPIKRKEISKKTAEELNLPVELVDDVVTFFYNMLHKKMISGDFYSIQIANLGQFVVKSKSLDALIDHTNNKIPYLEKIGTMLAYEQRLQQIKDLEKFKKLREELDREKQKRNDIHSKRKQEYESKSDRNLETEG
jgi:nucleoid DNA-binding protein